MSRLLSFTALLTLLIASTAIQAQQFERFGPYEVHYNVLNSDQIPAPVAQGYGIQRSSSRALVNIAVLDASDANDTRPVKAKVSATAVNLSGQLRDIEMRAIEDPDEAIYYIGEMPIHHLETYNFTVTVSVEGGGEPFEVKFRQQFFTE